MDGHTNDDGDKFQASVARKPDEYTGVLNGKNLTLPHDAFPNSVWHYQITEQSLLFNLSDLRLMNVQVEQACGEHQDRGQILQYRALRLHRRLAGIALVRSESAAPEARVQDQRPRCGRHPRSELTDDGGSDRDAPPDASLRRFRPARRMSATAGEPPWLSACSRGATSCSCRAPARTGSRRRSRAGPDMVTVDLEDAVIPAHKDHARDQAMALFDGRRRDAGSGIERVVRINPLRTPFGLKDLLALTQHPSPPDGDHAAQGRIRRRGAHRRCPPAARRPADRPARDHREQPRPRPGARDRRRLRLDALAAVRRASTWRPSSAPRMDFTSMLYARSRVVHAAASFGLDAIDVPWLDLEDVDGLREECRRVQRPRLHRQGDDPPQAAGGDERRVHAGCRSASPGRGG